MDGATVATLRDGVLSYFNICLLYDERHNSVCMIFACLIMTSLVLMSIHAMNYVFSILIQVLYKVTRMWANAQPNGRPAKHRCRPLFNAAKFG